MGVAILVVLLAGLVLAGGPVRAQSPAPVSAICALMFAQAAAPAPTPTPADPLATPEPAVALIEADPTALDATIRACATLVEWELLARLHPEAFGAVEPRAFLEGRCLDPEAGLDAYATCASLAIVRAAETPVPDPSAAPQGSPGPSDAPGGTPSTTPEEPKLVRVPAGLRTRVRGADRVRYFAIRGESPLELIAQASRRSAEFCPRDAAACTRQQPRIRVRTLVDTRTGACRITGVQASFRSDVFLPRWTRPSAVDKDLRAWWQRMFRRIAAHEARHIRIANAHLPDLRRRAEGRACESFRSIYGRWSNRLKKAQKAFDRRDARRPLPKYQGEPILP